MPHDRGALFRLGFRLGNLGFLDLFIEECGERIGKLEFIHTRVIELAIFARPTLEEATHGAELPLGALASGIDQCHDRFIVEPDLHAGVPEDPEVVAIVEDDDFDTVVVEERTMDGAICCS